MRRGIIGALCALGLLAGCAQQISQPVVTLASAQAEAGAILTALEAGATIYTTATSTTPAEAAAVENVLAIAKTAVSTFQAAQANETPAQLAQTVSQDITAVLAVLPIDPATKTAIDAGLAVIDALVAGLSAAPVAPVATPPLTMTHAAQTTRAPVPPPVPIPLPMRLPSRAS